MTKPVRIVVAGCGTIAELNHLPSLAALGGLVDVVGLVDPSPARLAACAALAPGASTFAGLDQALTALSPDEVVVASPAAFHKEQTLAALAAGAHVLCEKPLAITSADCDEMIAAADAAGRLLGVGLMRRFFPSVHAIRSILREGVLGAPVSFAVLEGFAFGWPVKSAHPFQRDGGGGVLLDAGPHLVDLLLTWFGDLDVLDYADDAAGGVETTCAIQLAAPGGVVGTVRLTRDLTLPNRHVIHCERGWVAYHYDVADEFFWGWPGSPTTNRVVLGEPPSDHPMWAEVDPGRKVASKLATYFVALHRNMAAAVQGTAELAVTAREAAKGIALLERCLSMRRLMAMPWIDDDEWAAAQRLEQEAAS